MSNAKLLLPLLLSVDSLIGCLATAPLFRCWSHRLALAVCFGLSDAIAYQIGSAFGVPDFLNHVGSSLAVGALVVYGVVCTAASWLVRVRVSPKLAFGLPLLMGVDNLVAGAEHGLGTVAQIVTLGVTSFLMGLGGLSLGAWFGGMDDRRRQLIAGSAMLAAAVVVAVF
jgi:hypothetical protein